VESGCHYAAGTARNRGQDFRQAPLVLAELSPRYYADASRDLERAVDWFLKLKEKGL
jgi:hypothetical protein